MKVTLIRPIKSIQGSLPDQGDTYFRELHGQQILQHKPRTSSEKQRAMRQAWIEKYRKRKSP